MIKDMIENVPVHVSMIMDGNGRWAKDRGKERVHGHFEGVESVRACVEAAVETGVKYLSSHIISSRSHPPSIIPYSVEYILLYKFFCSSLRLSS